MINILVVDDEAADRYVGQDAVMAAVHQLKLVNSAVNVLMVENEKTARQALNQNNFDIILMDMKLTTHGCDGIELTRLARERNPEAVIIGRSSNPDNGKYFKRAGADDFVCKSSHGLHHEICPQDRLNSVVHDALERIKPTPIMPAADVASPQNQRGRA